MKNFFVKIKNGFLKILPSKRKLIQLYSALLFNCYVKGYITGEIFTGITKNVCTPGLNCYSCPGAVTSCPLGALQNSFASSGKTTPYYMLGIIMLYGVIFGRWICGWLCPFGFIQELLHKIKTPKLKKNFVTRVLSYLKYVILVLFVVVLPLVYMFRDFPLPAFCKYICPAGTLGGAVGLLINPANADKFGMLGFLFSWKFVLMISIVVGCVFIYRMFCRFLCPLGLLYGFFNKIAIFGIKLEKKKCINCGRCVSTCKMDIRHVGDIECINCGECIPVCPTKAITWKGKQIILPDNEIEAVGGNVSAIEAYSTEKSVSPKLAAVISKRERRVKIINTVVAITLVLVLSFAAVYANFIYEPPTVDAGGVGDGEGDGADDGTVQVSDFRGKTVVVNFWGTWCGPCKAELPHFNELASEYSEDVVFLIVHTTTDRAEAPDYIKEHFDGSRMIFAYDTLINEKDEYAGDKYFALLGGTYYYPRTLVLDENGVITFAKDGAVSYDELKGEIDGALASTIDPSSAKPGYKVGNLCYSLKLELVETEEE